VPTVPTVPTAQVRGGKTGRHFRAGRHFVVPTECLPAPEGPLGTEDEPVLGGRTSRGPGKRRRSQAATARTSGRRPWAPGPGASRGRTRPGEGRRDRAVTEGALGSRRAVDERDEPVLGTEDEQGQDEREPVLGAAGIDGSRRVRAWSRAVRAGGVPPPGRGRPRDEPVLLAVDEQGQDVREGALGTRPTEGDERGLGEVPAFPAATARTSRSRGPGADRGRPRHPGRDRAGRAAARGRGRAGRARPGSRGDVRTAPYVNHMTYSPTRGQAPPGRDGPSRPRVSGR